MRKLLTKEQIFTIPNAMSAFRLVLIPLIIWTYLTDRCHAAVALVLISALTDIFDGLVARKFNMVSDLGKVLDPICDKLTQGALVICIMTRFEYVYLLFILLVLKESMMLLLGGLVLKLKESVCSAKWYGKLCTVVFEITMMLHMLFPEMEMGASNILVIFCGAVMLFSLAMYSTFFVRIITTKEE